MTQETMRIARGLMDVERRRLERHIADAMHTGCEILTEWCRKAMDTLDASILEMDEAMVKGEVKIEQA